MEHPVRIPFACKRLGAHLVAIGCVWLSSPSVARVRANGDLEERLHGRQHSASIGGKGGSDGRQGHCAEIQWVATKSLVQRGTKLLTQDSGAASWEVGASARPTPVEPKPYTVVTVFAGRADRISVLAGYLRILLDQGKVDQIHFWDFCKTDEDRRASELEAAKLGALFMEPFAQTNRSRFASYYEFYAESFLPPERVDPDRVVIVKADDDVVFIDTDRFQDFISTAADRTDMFLVHANIVNSGVASYYQQQHGAIHNLFLEYPVADGRPGHASLLSTGTILGNLAKAVALHRQFLDHPEAFRWEGKCIAFHHPNAKRFRWQGRFSINFMAARLPVWSTVWELARQATGDGHGAMSDEVMLTEMATKAGLKECMVPSFNVAHLSFESQRSIDGVVLPWYRTLLADRVHLNGTKRNEGKEQT